MRLLLLTECIAPIQGSSGFSTARGMVKALSDVPDCFIEWVLPKRDGKLWDYPDTAITYGPRVRHHFVPMMGTNLIDNVMCTRELHDLINVMCTDLYFDALLNMKCFSSPILKYFLKPRFERSAFDVPIFNMNASVRGPDPKKVRALNVYGEDATLLEAISSLLDFTIAHTKDEIRNLMAEYRKYMSPAMLLRAEKCCAPFAFAGLWCEEIDKGRADRKRGPVPCGFWGGRWDTTNKHFDLVCEAMKMAYTAGAGGRFICTTGSNRDDKLSELRRDYPFIDFRSSLPGSEFRRLVAEGDAFCCFSEFEGLPMAYAEMLYGGQIGFFVGRPWNKEFLPPGYPFIYKTNREVMEAFVHYLPRVHAGEYDRLVEPNRAWLKSNFGLPDQVVKMYGWIQQRTEEFYERTFSPGFLADLAVKSSEVLGDGPFSISTAFATMSRVSDAGVKFGHGGFICRPAIRRAFLSIGYRDLCDGPEPVFVRKTS